MPTSSPTPPSGHFTIQIELEEPRPPRHDPPRWWRPYKPPASRYPLPDGWFIPTPELMWPEQP